MENAVIVTLAPRSEIGVATFEQAFGEHSEARGKRAARVATRQANRQAKKVTKLQNKAEKKVLKQQVKTAKVQARGQKQAARQDNRAQRQEARQVKKDTRVVRRTDRRALRTDSRQLRRDTAAQGRLTRKTQRQASREQEPIEDEYTEDGMMDQGGAEAGYDEQGGGEQGGGEEEYVDNSPIDFTEGGEEEYYEEEYDSNPIAEAGYSQDEYADDYDSMEGTPSEDIHPDIKDLTNRIVWNQEALRKHAEAHEGLNAVYIQLGSNNEARAKNASQMKDVKSSLEGHDMQVQMHQERISELRGQLKKYGDHPHVKKGMKLATIKLQKSKEAKLAKKDKKKAMQTIVPASMNPSIMKQKIDIPASPGTKVVELTSGADGGASGSTVVINTGMSTAAKVLLIGAAIGVGYVLAKKYKLV